MDRISEFDISASRKTRGQDSHLVESIVEGILTAGCSTDDLPEINNELVPTRCSLSLGQFLQNAGQLHSRLGREGKRLVRLALRPPSLNMN